MELSFQSHPYHFLRSVMQEVRFQEETAEIIVPDSYPDIATIADCYAEAILRGKDCRDGSVTVAGGIKGVILYNAEDQSYARDLEVYIPFAVKFEHLALTSNAQVHCNMQVRSVDARMINSRKAMLRVNISCEITAYEEGIDVRYHLDGNYPALQTKETVYTTTVPMETAERSFTINDTIELPLGRPSVSRIYEFRCRPELTDEKLVGNKAVFKGILRCKILYLAENETLCIHEQNFVFSQYCELHTDYDDETVHTQFMITGYDLESEAGTDRQISVSINILAQCVVNGTKSVTVIEDAYCVGHTLTPQWSECVLEGYLDQQNTTQVIRHRLPGELREILDTTIYWDHPEIVRSTDRMTVKVPATICVLGSDEKGILQMLTAKSEAVYDMALSDGAACHASAVPVGEVLSSLDPGGAEVRGSVLISISCFSREKLRSLCGGEIEELEADSGCPALIVRAVEKETTLWELAKTYGTTIGDIMAANQLESNVLLRDSMLLLPIS